MYTYTRKNHFTTHLNNLQGYSQSKIDDCTFKSVKEDIDKNEGIINPSSVKASLRRLREARYYEDIYFIAEMLGWETPMRNLDMSSLLSDFEEFNDAYRKIGRILSLILSLYINWLNNRTTTFHQRKKNAF